MTKNTGFTLRVNKSNLRGNYSFKYALISLQKFMLKLFSILFLFISASSLKLYQEDYDTLLTLTDAPQFSLQGLNILSKIVSIYDGDSFKGVIKICGEFKKFQFRLSGLDTPQVKSGVVREFGKEVRDILIGMVGDKIVKIQAFEADKYGRVLCTVFARSASGQDININQYLVDHGMAKVYDGGTKDQFVQADYDRFIENFRNTVWPTFVNYPL